MLQKLNERIQGVVAWLVVILIVITFALFGVDYYMQSHQSSQAKVTVNGQPINQQAFEVNYRRARGMQANEVDESKLKNQVINQMINNEVMVQAAHNNGFNVSSAQADAAIIRIPQFQEDGHFSTQKYQQALNAALFTQLSFQNEVKQGMLLNQQRFAFIGSSFALPSEIERFVNLYMQTRDFDYLTLPVSHFEKEIKIAEPEIKAYYEANSKKFMTPEQVSIEYVNLSLNAIKDNIQLSEEEVKRHYNENQSNYLTPAQWRVAHILFAVPEEATSEQVDEAQQKSQEAYEQLQKDPKQFAQMVAKLSDDKLSVAQQGELPWITAGQNDYDRALSNLTTIGSISAPVRTKHGFEIFKLMNYRPVSTQTFNEVEATIKEQLRNEMAQTKYAQLLEQLTDLSYQSPDSLEPVANALHLKIEKTPLFSRAGEKEGVLSYPNIVQAAFSHNVLGLGDNSEPLQLDNDAVVVLRVNAHQAAKKQDLSAVHEVILKLLTQKQAQEKAKELGAEIAKGESLKGNELPFKWTSLTQIARDSDKANALIIEAAFNLLHLGNHEGLVLPNGDYVVVQLKAVHNGDLTKLDKEQQESLIQQIEASFGMMDYDLYAKNLVSQAKIIKN